jgi:hypothetical protein
MEIEKEKKDSANKTNNAEFRASLCASDSSFVALSFTDDFDPQDVKNEVDVVQSGMLFFDFSFVGSELTLEMTAAVWRASSAASLLRSR